MNAMLFVAMACSVISLCLTILLLRRDSKSNGAEITGILQKLNFSVEQLNEGFAKELRVNREETNKLSKESRDELNSTLKEVKSEISDNLKSVVLSSGEAFDKQSTKLDERLGKLILTIGENFKDCRSELNGSLKSFSETSNQHLDNIGKKVEDTLTKLSEDNKLSNREVSQALAKSLKDFQDSSDRSMKSFSDLQRDKFSQLEEKQSKLIDTTEKRLDQVKEIVEEKLQKTLNERLGQSFETVGKQLIEVQKGLGEMQNLAQDVGGLKKVLSNVKMRGGIGEVQLQFLLEQILAADQYMENVKIKPDSNERVEFAIKLPGRNDMQSQVWLPIDAKFPKECYEQLQDAYDTVDPAKIELSQKNLEAAIKKMAKDIRDKYIDPPNTTDFAIMFLPFEGIYAEVVRKASLLEELQRDYKVMITGPSTLAALLNSLQVGFKTLAIQKRTSEVWQVLGAVKKEFEHFGGLLQKAQNNIQTGLNQLDDVMGKRTRAIQRRLKAVEISSEVESQLLVPELSELELEE